MRGYGYDGALAVLPPESVIDMDPLHTFGAMEGVAYAHIYALIRASL
jgi:hypothetical protein